MLDGHKSHRIAAERCCPGQEMSNGNKASTHSGGTRPVVPLQFRLTLKRISIMVPMCVYLCVCLMGEGLWVWWRHWAEPSQLRWPTFPHQPAYPSKKKAAIHTLIQTCTCHLDEGKSTAALFVKLDCHCSLS